MATIALPPPLDDLLGPLETKAVTNFFGPPGAGKTNLCLLAMLRCVAAGGTVTYLDTEGGFSFARLAQLMPNYKVILNKVNLLEPKDFAEQGHLIRSLGKTDLVIVDSFSALYRLEYADAGQSKGVNPVILDANRELSRQLSILSTYARERHVPVIITSHTFRNRETGQDEVVGGEVIKYWSKGIVFVERTGRAGERKATVIKHRSLPEGKHAKFVIDGHGIKPAGFKLF